MIAHGATTASIEQIETSLWRAMLALGRALIALYLARVVARPGSTAGYVHDGAAFVFAEAVTTEIGTRFGKVVFERPVGRRVGWRRATVSDRQTAPGPGDVSAGGRDTLRGLSDRQRARMIAAAAAAASTSATSG